MSGGSPSAPPAECPDPASPTASVRPTTVGSPANAPARRDPAWQGRLFWTLAAAAALWPLLVLAEFKPWLLLSEDSLRPALRFLADFFPPRVDAEFLSLVARETWRTVAIATAGLTLALVIAVPMTLVATSVLSV